MVMLLALSVVELNQFADLEFEEFKNIYLMEPQVTHKLFA